MEKQNPSDNSPSSNDTPPPNPTNNNLHGGEGQIMKTPWQVLEELCSGDSDNESGDSDKKDGGSGGVPSVVAMEIGGDSDSDNNNEGSDSDNKDGSNKCKDDVSNSRGVPVVVAMEMDGNNNKGNGNSTKNEIPLAVAVAVSDGSNNSDQIPVAVPMVVAGGGGSSVAVTLVNEGVQEKKRKALDVRDPPRGKPICPVCSKEFPTWKGVFGHMRAHPNRDYRGFYKPPVFASSSQDQLPNKGDGAKNNSTSVTGTNEVHNSGEKQKGMASSSNQVLDFDLNEPVEEVEIGSFQTAEESVHEEKDVVFDLNEMPSV
ncbi:hypothetical protein Fmac_002687 [Flemingia macrophylla]|uniref:C2H2-type domain-containing protein n=1 Tax=Flemingia macrophylla TaxID=520843 RepID=A0ABD1NKL7_9FABA